VIENDGTSAGTKMFVDGKEVEGVQRLELSSDLNEIFSVMNVQIARKVNGKIKTKKVKIRDVKTQAFFERDEVETESLMLERNV
jgi:hypothetical protein